MSPAVAEFLPAILGALGVGGLLGAVVKAWADRRTAKDSTTVAAANLALDGFRELTTAQAAELAVARGEIRAQGEEHEQRFATALGRLDEATERADRIAREHAGLLEAYAEEREFVEILVRHIESGNPPPPPSRPRARHRLAAGPPPAATVTTTVVTSDQ